MSQSEQSFRARISRLFRERELYVRSDGHIRYITLKPYMLVMVVGVLITILTTGIVGSVSYFLARNSLFVFRENLNKTTDTYKFNTDKTFAARLRFLKRLEKHYI